MHMDLFKDKIAHLRKLVALRSDQLGVTLGLKISNECTFAFVRYNYVSKTGVIVLGESALARLPLYVLEFILMHELGHVVYATQKEKSETDFFVKWALIFTLLGACVIGVYVLTYSLLLVALCSVVLHALAARVLYRRIKESPSRKIGEEVFADFYAMKSVNTDLSWVLLPVIALEPACEADLTVRFRYVQELNALPAPASKHTLVIEGVAVNLNLKDIYDQAK